MGAREKDLEHGSGNSRWRGSNSSPVAVRRRDRPLQHRAALAAHGDHRLQTALIVTLFVDVMTQTLTAASVVGYHDDRE